MEELRLDHPPKMMHFLCVGCYIQDTPVNTQKRVYDLITAKQATDGSAPDGKKCTKCCHFNAICNGATSDGCGR